MAYYTGKDVSALSDIEWCKEIARLAYIRRKEAESANQNVEISNNGECGRVYI